MLNLILIFVLGLALGACATLWYERDLIKRAREALKGAEQTTHESLEEVAQYKNLVDARLAKLQEQVDAKLVMLDKLVVEVVTGETKAKAKAGGQPDDR